MSSISALWLIHDECVVLNALVAVGKADRYSTGVKRSNIALFWVVRIDSSRSGVEGARGEGGVLRSEPFPRDDVKEGGCYDSIQGRTDRVSIIVGACRTAHEIC